VEPELSCDKFVLSGADLLYWFRTADIAAASDGQDEKKES
jgi:hypothetical protein